MLYRSSGTSKDFYSLSLHDFLFSHISTHYAVRKVHHMPSDKLQRTFKKIILNAQDSYSDCLSAFEHSVGLISTEWDTNWPGQVQMDPLDKTGVVYSSQGHRSRSEVTALLAASLCTNQVTATWVIGRLIDVWCVISTELTVQPSQWGVGQWRCFKRAGDSSQGRKFFNTFQA